jgi:hypothetical protein
MAVINDRGEGNLFRNAILNVKQVIKDNFFEETGRKIKEIYEETVSNPVTPSIALLVVDSKDILRESNALRSVRYTINIGMEIWYYHCDLTEETKRNEVTYILWEISKMMKKYPTLNGFTPKLGTEVLGARYVASQFNNKVLAGGVISLYAKKLYTVAPSI